MMGLRPTRALSRDDLIDTANLFGYGDTEWPTTEDDEAELAKALELAMKKQMTAADFIDLCRRGQIPTYRL
jgi:hypothetical protein